MFPINIEKPSITFPQYFLDFYTLNLRLVDEITDKTDMRTVWRHVSDFTHSFIIDSNFTGADLSHAIILDTKIENVDFTDSEISNLIIYSSYLNNVKLNNNHFTDSSIDTLSLPSSPKPNYKDISKIHLEKFSNTKVIDIKFLDALDDTPINWSFGMTIYDGKLFVADTDNHRIVVYDSNTLLELFSFTSPIQHYCDSVNVYTSGNNYCSNELRNLPTSIAIFDEKIFVSYGFQNDIQVFDLEGNYLWKFGSYGSQDGEFNGVYNIATSDDKLYVADSENHRIQIFDSEGKFVKQFSTNVDNTSTSTPYDLSIFDDRIFVTDTTR